jgi:hypothetical protein
VLKWLTLALFSCVGVLMVVHVPLREAPEQARAHLKRIKLDTCIGMISSNVIAL